MLLIIRVVSCVKITAGKMVANKEALTNLIQLPLFTRGGELKNSMPP